MTRSLLPLLCLALFPLVLAGCPLVQGAADDDDSGPDAGDPGAWDDPTQVNCEWSTTTDNTGSQSLLTDYCAAEGLEGPRTSTSSRFRGTPSCRCRSVPTPAATIC